ncbi:peptidoglycan D,D-transpeptidase FtsI family protein [Saccharothrix longispora]|uniref:Cell division protein FtsI (Penicillin-binding protein 3) n=1 Tax=Saccharothrix longispora TaxID=33920 RepID=A0ABU1PZC2_9PSEU|nr:penicillin-binding protein 2 [Saccharothrix longispora]MDR6595972.1 cell division protein FtsI (penicillin-binding protein 3) [Saccharothrix longispora]
MPGPSRGRPARRPLSVRPSAPKRRRGGNSRVRLAVGRLLLVGALLAAGVKLVQVQGFQAEALSAQAEQQRATPIDIPAARGSILDRNGNQLAFSVEARALYAVPRLMRQEWAKALERDPDIGSFEARIADIAAFVEQTLGKEVAGQKTDRDTVLAKLSQDTTYVELADNVDPGKAAIITDKYFNIGSEYRAVRVYPNGELASNIIGAANWRKDKEPPATHGLLGLEISEDNLLAGSNGRRVVDTMQGNDDVVIPGPGRSRELAAATPGKSLELTLDVDTQYALQRMVTEYTRETAARSGSAVVLDARTGEILAMANDKTFDPNRFGKADEEHLRNAAVSTVFEPGSVHKIVTAAAAVEDGIHQPDSVLGVDDSIRVSDRVIRDSAPHPRQDMTFTGVFAKSSNVGTLMAAQEIGEDRYAEMLTRFGLGKRTQSGLPGEEAGYVPPRNQWSGSTFGNLPIGQGLSTNLLQMTGMYQAIANDGVRVPPRIIRAEVSADGARQVKQPPEGVRVVSPETAKTVRDMFRAVVQRSTSDPDQTGTGPSAALPGYQVSGKTGTAQQVDPKCGCYSHSQHWITFAGIFPADNPRFVVGIMLDNPTVGEQSAAPLFHDVASYLSQRYQVPMSAEQSPVVPLILTP